MQDGNTLKYHVSPLVSVIMPVYNAETTICAAIKSVLYQTFQEWELLVLDDGSQDNTLQCVKQFSDPRIRVCFFEHNYINTLNKGLSLAKGKDIARMDADDMMVPERLQIQYTILEQCPHFAICSSWIQVFGDKIANKISGTLFGEINDALSLLLHGNFISHPTVMFRKDFFDQYGLLYKEYPYAEDFKLWFDAVLIGARIYIEPQPLVFYRLSNSQATFKYRQQQIETTQKIQLEIIKELIAIHLGNIFY